jgi:hypothetical protein
MITRELVIELSALKGSVNNITDAAEYSEVCGRRVPRRLIDYHKSVRNDMCLELIRCESGGETWHDSLEGV